MTDTGDRIKGKANEMLGRGKQGAGEAMNDREMKREGQAQELKGRGQNLKGEVKQNLKRSVDDL